MHRFVSYEPPEERLELTKRFALAFGPRISFGAAARCVSLQSRSFTRTRKQELPRPSLFLESDQIPMPSVSLKSARTAEKDPVRAVEALVKQLDGGEPKLITLFAPRAHDHVALNKAVRERFPKARLVGASSAGEIDREGIHSDSVLLGALSGDFEVGIGVGRNLSTGAVQAGEDAIVGASRELSVSEDQLSSKKHVALVIDDGFRYKKEEFLMGIMSRNQGLVAVGGGAADSEQDPAKQSALIHVDDEVTTDSVATVLFKTDAPWAAFRSHWYHPTGRTLKLTKVDVTTNRAIEIDGKPAAARYAELLGVTPDDLEFGKPTGFGVMPTALKVGREYFIRAPWKPLPDGSILFANMLEPGVELELVRIGDPAADTRKFFEVDIPARVPNPRAAFLFHCSGRVWQATAMGEMGNLSDTFKSAPPCVGLNVYFETYCGFHINTTLTSLVFGASS